MNKTYRIKIRRIEYVTVEAVSLSEALKAIGSRFTPVDPATYAPEIVAIDLVEEN